MYGSLSARRAWIEIASRRRVPGRPLVALRKESVDRNLILPPSGSLCCLSLSARRAWIERCTEKEGPSFCELSLSARRAWIEIVEFHLFASSGVSLSARRAWIEIVIA